MNTKYKYLLIIGIITSLTLPILYGGRQAIQQLYTASHGVIFLMIGMIALCWNINAQRVALFVGGIGHHLGHSKALSILMATEFSIVSTPGGSGGPIVYSWLLSRHGIGYAQSLALYAADQFLDMLFFVLALCSIFLYWIISHQFSDMNWKIAGMTILLIVLMFGVGLFINYYRSIFMLWKVIRRYLGIQSRRGYVFSRRILKFRRSLMMVKQFSKLRLSALFLLCSIHWLLRYSILYLSISAVGGHISWVQAFIIQMLALTAGQLSLMPGGSGGSEITSGILLSTQLDPATASSAILLWRFVTYYWYVIVGAPVFSYVLKRRLTDSYSQQI